MPVGRGYRSNPYGRTPLQSNPYLASVMQGIDMLAADAQQEQERFRQSEEEKALFEREKKQKTAERKFGLLSDLIKSKETTPETKANVSDTFFQLIQDPDLDLSTLDPQFKKEKPEEEEPAEQLYPVSARATRMFPLTKGKTYPFDIVKMYETQAVELEKEYHDTTKKGGGGLFFNFGGKKVAAEPILKDLAEKKKRGVSVIKTGIQAEGEGMGKIGKSEALMAGYIQTIEDLEEKIRNNEWDDEAQATYEALKSPEQHGLEGTEDFNMFRDSQFEFQRRMNEIFED